MLYAIDKFFQNNLDAVYLVYGLAFFTMGIAIFMRPRRETRLSLARILWLRRLEMNKYPPQLKRFVEKLSWPITPILSLIICFLSILSQLKT